MSLKKVLKKVGIQAESIPIGEYRQLLTTINNYPEEDLLNCLLLGLSAKCIELVIAINLVYNTDKEAIAVDKKYGEVLGYCYAILNYYETDLEKDKDVIEAEKMMPEMVPSCALITVSAVKNHITKKIGLDEKRVIALRTSYNIIGQVQNLYGDEYELILGLNINKIKGKINDKRL